jgi:hypothetical protein
VLILVAFYDTHELRWGYSLLPPHPTGAVDGNTYFKMTSTGGGNAHLSQAVDAILS